MTGHGAWLLQTVESDAIGATVGALVGGTVSGLYKRAVHRKAKRLEQMLLALEHLLGGWAVEFPTIAQEGTMSIDLKRYRKGIAAGFGVMLTGLLTWAETADLEPVLGPLVPPLYRPLVGVVLGGVALTASVILAPNAPKAQPEPEPEAQLVRTTRSTAAAIGSPSLASLVAGVRPTGQAVGSETSLVTLLPAPTRSSSSFE